MTESSEPVTVEEMYGPMALSYDRIDEILDESRDPIAATSLYDTLGGLGVGPEHDVLDIGARDARHGLELAARFGCRVVAVEPSEVHLEQARQLVADHPVGHRVDLRQGIIETIPAGDDTFDVIWARDMLCHIVDIGSALSESRRVLVESGALVVYQTFATPRLEPAEAELLYAGLAVVPQRMVVEGFESRVREAGFVIEQVVVVGSQWREAWEQDGTRTTSRQLLHAARLIRKGDDLVDELGATAYRVELANALWGVYQMIGKLEPRIYVLRSSPT